MSVKITCDCCGADIKPETILTLTSQFPESVFSSGLPERHDFCCMPCLHGWIIGEQKKYGWKPAAERPCL